MFQKNSLVSGLLFGLLLPILGFGVLYGIFSLLESAGFLSDVGFRPYFRERMISIVAIALNGMALNYYNKRRFTETMRGIVLVTFAMIVIWVILFKDVLFAAS